MQKDIVGTIDYEPSEDFQHYSSGLCKTLKASTHDICAIEVINLGVDIENDRNTIFEQAS